MGLCISFKISPAGELGLEDVEEDIEEERLGLLLVCFFCASLSTGAVEETFLPEPKGLLCTACSEVIAPEVVERVELLLAKGLVSLEAEGVVAAWSGLSFPKGLVLAVSLFPKG